MWLYLILFSWTLLVGVDIARGEVYSWTDPGGNIHFSDTPPADHKAKRLHMQSDCPLRGKIVELRLDERANLGLWLFLGAPKIGKWSNTNRYGNRGPWPADSWEYERYAQSQRIRELKNQIIFEARLCAVGVDQACACSLSLFHDPPRGFAPQGYVLPSVEAAKARGRQLAEQAAGPP